MGRTRDGTRNRTGGAFLTLPPNNTPERHALVDILSGTHGAVTVACATRHCAALATSVEKAFADGGWTVTKIRKGGLGISGVQGLRVTGCGSRSSTAKIAEAVKKVTSREVEVVAEPSCSGDDDLDIVIGDKPED